jgi:hypothetical protein
MSTVLSVDATFSMYTLIFRMRGLAPIIRWPLLRLEAVMLRAAKDFWGRESERHRFIVVASDSYEKGS